MRMDLEAEGWAGGESYDQGEIPEGINYTKNF